MFYLSLYLTQKIKPPSYTHTHTHTHTESQAASCSSLPLDEMVRILDVRNSRSLAMGTWSLAHAHLQEEEMKGKADGARTVLWR